MDTTLSKKPKTMAELLPGLGGLLSKNAMRTAIMHTATKKPHTTEKVLKPLTLAEMRTEIQSLQSKSPSKAQASASVKKRWNSSCKPENKFVRHTANGQMKHNSVRKVLNFQPHKPQERKSYACSKIAMMNTETPKFPKPEIRAKKSLHLQALNMVRISGICNIPETPVTIDKPTNTMTLANKENITNQQNEYKKLIATPKSTVRKQVLVSRIPDTPLYNESYNTSNDVSFLKNERDIENKTKALVLPEEYQQTLENIAEVPASTPFAEYRNANDFFSNSSNMIESSCNDNTIMCFDYIVSKDIDREESVIVSLCDLLNKATVSKTEKYSTELHDLLEMQKRIENNIQVIEKTMNNLKESELKSLEYVKKLIQEKKNHQSSESEKEKTAVATKESPKDEKLLNPEIIVGKPCSVIKTILKSPSYKTSKKCNSLRKKVSYKSMSNTSALLTPEKVMGVKAMSMYMKIKERHNYLNTPAVKREAPDTPAITSHNLRKQLDKLYDEN